MANENRLIVADALETRMGNLCDEFGTDHLFIDAIIYEIGTAPTVDAAPVVRCKDCKKWHTPDCIMSDGLMEAEDNDFCSYGERRAET